MRYLALALLLFGCTVDARIPKGGCTCTGGGGLAIVTSSPLPNATVGGAYLYQLSAINGTPPYTWSYVYPTAATIGSGGITNANPTVITLTTVSGSNPFTGLSQAFIDGGAANTSTAGNFGSTVMAINSLGGSSGAWTVTTTFNGTNFGTGVTGGNLRGGAVTGSTWWLLNKNGWLMATPTTAESDTVTVTVTDSLSATVSKTFNITVNSTLAIQAVNSAAASQALPGAMQGAKYYHTLYAAGGTGTYSTWGCTGLPAGLSIANTGIISGTPSSAGTTTGIVCTVTDSGASTANQTYSLVVAANGQVSRPAYNSTVGNGFFVANGTTYDPNGWPLNLKGLNRNHYDTGGGSDYARTGSNVVRQFLNGAAPHTSQITAMNTQLIASHIIPMPTGTYFSPCDSTVADMGTIVAGWVSDYSAFSTYQASMLINIENEWGPTNQNWQYAYQYVSATITNVTATTVTFSGTSGLFANAATIGQVYLKGITGIADGLYAVSSSSGNTITGTFTTGYVSGGTVYGGAVGILRAVGYTAPLVIDAPNCGQDTTAFNSYSSAVFNSDPLKNIIFSYHQYGLGFGFPPGGTEAQQIANLNVLVTLKGSVGADYIVGEFGPSTPPLSGGPSPMLVDQDTQIADFNARGVEWIYWAFDDGSLAGNQCANTNFGFTKTKGNYGVFNDLWPRGTDLISNPAYGIYNNTTYAPYLLP